MGRGKVNASNPRSGFSCDSETYIHIYPLCLTDLMYLLKHNLYLNTHNLYISLIYRVSKNR